jgi:hypothetical protein
MEKFRSIIAGSIALVLVLAFVAGCGASLSSREDQSLGMPGMAPEPEVAEVEKVVVEAEATRESMASAEGYRYAKENLAYAAERLIIRTGNISMVVEDTRGALATIEEMVAGMAGEGAFVVSSQEYGATEGEQPHISMTIRVPAARFDQTMDRLADMAVQVTNRNETADDVTEEYVDLEARLETLEAARQRLLDIMAESRSTKDLLEAEQQLTQREAEIESIKGRMQYLEQSARLSSISIDLSPHILSQPVSQQWRPAETARRAVEALVDGLQGFGDFAIFFGIAILPWLVAAGLLLWLVVALVRWRGRVRDRRRAAPQAPDTDAS